MSKKIEDVPLDRFLTIQTYAKESTARGFKISAMAIRSRIANELMEMVKFDDVEGYFIDTDAYPFSMEFKRGPKVDPSKEELSTRKKNKKSKRKTTK
jgi:hypothetical protein